MRKFCEKPDVCEGLIARPHGQAMGVYCQESGENWPNYNGTALYLLMITENRGNAHGVRLYKTFNINRGEFRKHLWALESKSF